jgi:hypothetical protein
LVYLNQNLCFQKVSDLFPFISLTLVVQNNFFRTESILIKPMQNLLFETFQMLISLFQY